MLCVSPHGLDDPDDGELERLAASPAMFAEHARSEEGEGGFDTTFGSDTLLASTGGGAADLLYIRVDFDDRVGEPVSVQNAGNAIAAVSDFMLDSSWGQFGFGELDVTSIYRMPYTTDEYVGREDGFIDLMDDAMSAALQDGYHADDYWSFAVVFDVIPDWNWSGMAWVGAPGVWLNGAGGDAPIIAHEFGHNLGAWHSGWWQVSDGEPVSPSGELVEYGDPFDVMGTPWDLFPENQFNTYWKTQFGWMDAQTNVLSPEGNGTYRLHAHDFGVGTYEPGLPYAIEIPFDDDRGYWIEYRQSVHDTIDDSGIEVRWTPWEESGNNMLLLDMSGTGDDPFDSPLWIGETFAGSGTEFSITPSAAGATAAGNWWIDVELVFGDTTAPPWVTEVAADDVTAAFAADHEFAVTYADDTGLDTATIVNRHDAVTVTGPGEFEASAAYIGIDEETNGTPRQATYRIDAPGGGWRTDHNGSYTVRVEPERVADTSGNFVPAGPIGSFEVDVDSVPPAAHLIAEDVTEPFATDHTFQLMYTDNAALDAATILENGSAVRVTGPDGFEWLASFVTIDDTTDGTPRRATYRIDGPDGGWRTEHNGAYTVHVEAERVADTSGNFVPAGPVGAFDVDVDAVPPEATLSSDTVTERFSTEHVFQVVYTDNLSLDVATILGNDGAIRITGPGGFESSASFIDIDGDADGTPRAAMYRIDAPEGGWRTAHNGTYTVHVQAEQVADTSGNFLPAGQLGAFAVSVGIEATVGPDDARFLRYTDESGTRVTLRLTGGRGEVLLGGTGLELQQHGRGLLVTGGPARLDQLVLSGTDARTLLSMVGRGGDGTVRVGTITGDSPLGWIVGPRADLIGDGIVMSGEGTAHLIHLHELRNGANLILPGEAGNGAVIRLAGGEGDSCIMVGSGIRLLHARESLAGSIEAPWIGALRVHGTLSADVTVSGDDGRGVSIRTLIAGDIVGTDLAAPGHIGLVRSGGWAGGSLEAGSIGTLLVHGDFGADLALTDPEPRLGLARALIRGDVVGTSWALASDAASVTVLGSARDWTLEAARDLRVLRLAGADAAEIHIAGRTHHILVLGDLVQSRLHVADQLRNLNVRGDARLDLETPGRIHRAVVLGHLTGEWEAESIGLLHVRGDLRGTRIGLARPADADRPHHRALDRLHVGRWIDDTAVRAAGHIGTVLTGGLRDSTLFAGVGEGVSGLPDDRDAFDALAAINLLRVRGVAGSTFDLVNSHIAAWHIRHTHLQHLQPDNGGTPFGLAAAELDSYLRREGADLYRWPNRIDPQPTADGDALIRLV